ncbi:MAG: hypothetical protein ABMB14_17510 [Myxococcota bacterium]
MLGTIGFAAAALATPDDVQMAVLVGIPSVGVRIPLPPGFEPADGFVGFADPTTGSSVLVQRMAAPYAEIAPGFEPAPLKSEGMKLLDREDLTLAGAPAILASVRQRSGGVTYQKWLLATGDAESTVLIVATFPKAVAAVYGPMLREVLRGVEPGPAPDPATAASVDFSLASTDLLQPMPAITGALAFTRTGRPLDLPGDPFLMAVPSLGPVPVPDPGALAVQLVRSIDTIEIADPPPALVPVTVDGRDALEIVVHGTDRATGTPLTVYQLLIVGDGYHRVVGTVGTVDEAAWIPEFQRLGRSLTRD